MSKKKKVKERFPQSPDRYIVEMGNGLREVSEGGLIIIPEFELGENVEITGTIVALPKVGGIPGLKVGDEIAFSYLVAASEDVSDVDNDDIFYPDEQVHPRMKSWSNGKGETLVREYLLNLKYKGILLAGDPQLIVDQVGPVDYGHWESWHESRGKFRETATMKKDHIFSWKDEPYWLVDPAMVYAVRRAHEITAMPGVVLVSAPDKFIREVQDDLIIKPVRVADGPQWVKAECTAPFDELLGKETLLHTAFAPRYKFWGMEFLAADRTDLLAYVE